MRTVNKCVDAVRVRVVVALNTYNLTGALFTLDRAMETINHCSFNSGVFV